MSSCIRIESRMALGPLASVPALMPLSISATSRSYCSLVQSDAAALDATVKPNCVGRSTPHTSLSDSILTVRNRRLRPRRYNRFQNLVLRCTDCDAPDGPHELGISEAQLGSENSRAISSKALICISPFRRLHRKASFGA